MTNTKETTNGELLETIKPLGRVITSFRPLPETTEEEQERLIRVAMEVTGIKKYQQWEVVEHYTVLDSIKDTWYSFFGRTKRALGILRPSLGSASPNEAQEGKEDGALIATETLLDSGPPTSTPNRKPEKEDNTIDESWVILAADWPRKKWASDGGLFSL